MSLKIIMEDCTDCVACIEPCPNTAISRADGIYEIDPDKCTECVGHHDDPQCIEVCPSDCIIPDPENEESEEELQQKYEQLQAAAA